MPGMIVFSFVLSYSHWGTYVWQLSDVCFSFCNTTKLKSVDKYKKMIYPISKNILSVYDIFVFSFYVLKICSTDQRNTCFILETMFLYLNIHWCTLYGVVCLHNNTDQSWLNTDHIPRVFFWYQQASKHGECWWEYDYFTDTYCKRFLGA